MADDGVSEERARPSLLRPAHRSISLLIVEELSADMEESKHSGRREPRPEEAEQEEQKAQDRTQVLDDLIEQLD